MIAQLCEYTEKYWIAYFKWVTCVVCKLYLNKVVYLKVLQNGNICAFGSFLRWWLEELMVKVSSKNLVTYIKLSFCFLSVTLSPENDWAVFTEFGQRV